LSHAGTPTASHQYAVCTRNAGLEAPLEITKRYAVLNDSGAEADHLIRAIDESGEDYLYRARLFQRLTSPAEVQRALRLAW